VGTRPTQDLTRWTLARKALNAKTPSGISFFTGTATIEESGRPRLEGQEAFPEVRMAEDGRASTGLLPTALVG
jgi:hypothetical protein